MLHSLIWVSYLVTGGGQAHVDPAALIRGQGEALLCRRLGLPTPCALAPETFLRERSATALLENGDHHHRGAGEGGVAQETARLRLTQRSHQVRKSTERGGYASFFYHMS